jgi:hypothetical protein
MRDMYRVLSIPVCDTPPKTAHYSPMLHNAIVAVALAFSDNIQFSDLKNRQYFVRKAESYSMDELARPSIAGVHALSMLGSYYASVGEQNCGYIYIGACSTEIQIWCMALCLVLGMSARMSQARKDSIFIHANLSVILVFHSWSEHRLFTLGKGGAHQS